jgi:quercetin dioxygenase-like cupin family protein
MRKTGIVVGVIGVLVGLAVSASADKGGKATLSPAADMKWADVPGFAGVHMTVADGDPTKGASHFYLKFDKGFAAPLHHHTADHTGTVVAGTLVLTVDGKETRLPPGSFFSFSGKKVHMTSCDAAADCVLAMDARGKWDVVPEAAPKAADVKKPAAK